MKPKILLEAYFTKNELLQILEFIEKHPNRPHERDVMIRIDNGDYGDGMNFGNGITAVIGDNEKKIIDEDAL